jgi:hypothetical protein
MTPWRNITDGYKPESANRGFDTLALPHLPKRSLLAMTPGGRTDGNRIAPASRIE